MSELMVVVAIIGILAMLATRGFGDAVVRARVGDGLAFVGPLKFAVVDNLTANPNGDGCAGVDPLGPAGHLASAVCSDDGTDVTVHLVMTPDAANAEVDFVVGRDAKYVWDCRPDPGFTDVHLLPSNCRN